MERAAGGQVRHSPKVGARATSWPTQGQIPHCLVLPAGRGVGSIGPLNIVIGTFGRRFGRVRLVAARRVWVQLFVDNYSVHYSLVAEAFAEVG